MKHFLSFFLLLMAGTLVQAAPRVALVIGNNAYRDLSPSMQLTSPAHDAADVAVALQKLGYTLVGGAAVVDATREQITAATEQFAAAARGAEAAVFYFSGHGIQVGEDNYLLPSDTPKLTGLSMLKNRAVLLRDSVMVALEEAGAASKVIILDCCRDNPFSAQLETALAQVGKSVKTKSVGEITGYGPGFYLAFATSPGSTAADGNGERNSPFTTAFLKALPGGAGKDIDFFFRDVKALLPDDQVSWTNHSIKGSFALVPGTNPPASAPMAPEPVPPSPPAAPAAAVNLPAGGQRVTIEKELARKYSDQALSELSKIDTDPNSLGQISMMKADATSIKIQALCDIAIIKHKTGDLEGCGRAFDTAKKLSESTIPHWDFSGDESFLLSRLTLNAMPTVMLDKSAAFFCIAKTEYSIQLNDEHSKRLIMQPSDQWIDDALSGDAWSRAIFLSRLAEAQMGIGEFETAEKTFAKAKATAEKQKNTRNRLKSLIEVECIMAASYHHAGNFIKRDQTLSHAKAVANAAKEHSNAVENLAEIAYIQILLNDRESGFETFRMAVSRTLKMADTYEKGLCLKDIAVLQAKCGQKAEAQQTLEQIKERYQGGEYEYKNEALLEMQASEAKRHSVARLDDLKKNSSQSTHDEIAGAIAKMISPLDRCASFISLASGLLEK